MLASLSFCLSSFCPSSFCPSLTLRFTAKSRIHTIFPFTVRNRNPQPILSLSFTLTLSLLLSHHLTAISVTPSLRFIAATVQRQRQRQQIQRRPTAQLHPLDLLGLALLPYSISLSLGDLRIPHIWNQPLAPISSHRVSLTHSTTQQTIFWQSTHTHLKPQLSLHSNSNLTLVGTIRLVRIIYHHPSLTTTLRSHLKVSL